MKTTLTAAFAVLLSTQVQATGFYQDVVGNAPQSHDDNYVVNTDSSHTPLYEKVISHDPRFLAEPGTLVRDFSYTPLYLKVTGQDRIVNTRIADSNESGSDDTI